MTKLVRWYLINNTLIMSIRPTKPGYWHLTLIWHWPQIVTLTSWEIGHGLRRINAVYKGLKHKNLDIDLWPWDDIDLHMWPWPHVTLTMGYQGSMQPLRVLKHEKPGYWPLTLRWPWPQNVTLTSCDLDPGHQGSRQPLRALEHEKPRYWPLTLRWPLTSICDLDLNIWPGPHVTLT